MTAYQDMPDHEGALTDEPTPKQRWVLKWVAAYVAERGFPPTLVEIAAVCGSPNPTAARSIVEALEAKGLVTHEVGKARTLALTEAGRDALRERA